MTPYLYQHPNPNAPVRPNGIRFWGHPQRTVAPRVIGVHTTESAFDEIGTDTGAEGVAGFQASTPRPSSYHRIVDRDSTVVDLPDEAVAFGIGTGGLNSCGLHLSMAMRAADWSDPAKARAARPTLERAAAVAAEWCHAYAIPPVRLSFTQATAGRLGLIAHGDADPTRRTDPGHDFPWPLFLQLIQARLQPEDDMALSNDDKKWFTSEIDRLIKARLKEQYQLLHVGTGEATHTSLIELRTLAQTAIDSARDSGAHVDAIAVVDAIVARLNGGTQ